MPRHIHSRVVIKDAPRVYFKDLSADGVVGLAFDEEHKIVIDPSQSPRELWLTIFHECCHVTLPSLNEKQIVKLEKTIGVLLWKQFLRLQRQQARQPRL